MALSARSASRRPLGCVAGVAVPLAQGRSPPPRLCLRRRHAAARCCLTSDLGPPWPLVPYAAGRRLGGVQPPSPPRAVGAGRARSVRVPLGRCPSAGPAVAELSRAAVSVASAGFGRPGRPGQLGNLEAWCALPLFGHTTPLVPAAHPRHAKRVTAAECGRSRLQTSPAPATCARARPLARLRVTPQDNASLAQPAPGQGPCHGSRGQSGSQHR